MEQSTTITELAKALSKMQGALKSVPKDSTNPFYKMRYASLDAIWDTCRKPLTDNGLCLIQVPLEVDGRIYLETTLLHSTGEWIKCQLAINAKQATPQEIGSAITYARRYSLSAMLGISADEDDDAESASGRGEKPSQVKTQGEPIKEHWCAEHNVAFKEYKSKDGKSRWYSHKLADDSWCNEDKKKVEVIPSPEKPAEPPPASPGLTPGASKPVEQSSTPIIDPVWLDEALAKIKKASPAKYSELVSSLLKINPGLNFRQAIAGMNEDLAISFANKVKELAEIS